MKGKFSSISGSSKSWVTTLYLLFLDLDFFSFFPLMFLLFLPALPFDLPSLRL